MFHSSRGQLRTRPNRLILGLAAAALATTSACGSSGGAFAPTATSAAHSSTAAPPSSSTPPAPPSATATPFTINYRATDGTAITVTFALNPRTPAGNSTVSTFFPNGAPCDADPARDAVFTGTLTVTNHTAGFSADLHMGITTNYDTINKATASFGIAYADGNECDDLNGEDAQGAAQPAIHITANPTWGPTNIEFVIHGAYSPANPTGDNALIAGNAPILTAFQGRPTNLQRYQVVGVGPHVAAQTAVDPVMLRLDQVG